MPETQVSSFILRFVQERPDAGWHGMIRHVQSSEEIRFSNIQEALSFLAGFVDLDNPDWSPPAPTEDSQPVL